MRWVSYVRPPGRWSIVSRCRGPLLLVAASTLAIALAAGAVAGVLDAGVAVLASVVAGQPPTSIAASLVAALARGLAAAVGAAITALTLAGVAAVPFVVQDIIRRRTRHEPCTDPQEQSTSERISRRTLLTVMVAGCAAGVCVEQSVSGYLQSLADQEIAAQNTAITDTTGKRIRLRGINWFGFETDAFAPHGLSVRNYDDMLGQMADLGFNTLRLPYSNQLFDPGSVPSGIDEHLNPDLRGLSGVTLLDAIVAGAWRHGLHVILDRHRPNAYAQSDLWYTEDVPESRWIDDWITLARRYRGNPAVLGADLHNEPHGAATWGDGNRWTDWRLAAERAGNAILAVNPNWRIFVQGVERVGTDYYWWGGNLEGAGASPVRLTRPHRLVYEAHDYGPEIYMQAWFRGPHLAERLPSVWRRYWAYLQLDGRSPVLLGEFGGRSTGRDLGGQWQRALAAYLKRHRISYVYWSWNPDSGDTGGLLLDDWKTLDQAKLAVLRAAQ
jgi:endoglucanase